MKLELLKPSDFKTFWFSLLTQCNAAEDANNRLNQILNDLLNDPTGGAKGKHAEGYRECLNDIRQELERIGNGV